MVYSQSDGENDEQVEDAGTDDDNDENGGCKSGISSEAKDAFQAAFEKEVAALFRVSEAGGGVLLSEDKLATIKQTLQNYDSMDGPERRAANAYALRRKWKLGGTFQDGRRDLLRNDNKVPLAYENMFDTLYQVHAQESAQLPHRTPDVSLLFLR